MGPGPQLLVFAKAPRPGVVKTRLAAAIGSEAAAKAQVEMLAVIVARLAPDPRWRTTLVVAPDETAADAALWPAGVARRGQGEGDLGARMARALAAARPEAPTLIVGSDIPAMTADHIARALVLLETHDLVFGPAVDGGFWLVGARRPPPAALFDGVRWSSAQALADCLARTGQHRPALADILEDVDDVDSWRRWLAEPKA